MRLRWVLVASTGWIVGACTIPFDRVADAVWQPGTIDSLFIIQGTDTTLAFVASPTDPVIQPDMPFRVRWVISGGEGEVVVLVSHPTCNPGADPTEPSEVPDCPQLHLDVAESCVAAGSAVVSGLPGGHPWSLYDLVVMHRVRNAGTPSPCQGVEPSPEWGQPNLAQIFYDLSTGVPSPNSLESIAISAGGS